MYKSALRPLDMVPVAQTNKAWKGQCNSLYTEEVRAVPAFISGVCIIKVLIHKHGHGLLLLQLSLRKPSAVPEHA